MIPPTTVSVSVCFLLLLLQYNVASALPNRFIAEVVTDEVRAIKGTFAPNPRNDNKPMLVLLSKWGDIHVLEDPDESPKQIEILDLSSHICTDQERGLHNIIVVEEAEVDIFNNNTDGTTIAKTRNVTYAYVYYTSDEGGCSSNDEPWNVLHRFTMDQETLQLDYDSRKEIWRGTPSTDGNHNGGGLLRGNDGKLYITTGDASHSENSQDLSNLHGKVIRINTDGTIPDDNPFVGEDDTYHCSKFGGSVPGATGKCLEIFAYGLRNPFRVAMDPSEITKTKFVISDVGADTWEELDPAGTDYAGANYGFPEREGPCAYQSKSFCYTKDDDSKVVDPIHFYLHYKDGRTSGAAVGAAAFVPNSIGWPSDHSFLVSDFIFQEVYSLTEDNVNECGDECDLPVSRFGNTTFFQSIGNDGDDYNAPRIVDIFFGPYKDTQALYIVRYGSSYQSFDNIIRIRYTGLDNDPPIVKLDVEGENFPVGSSIAFSALESKDPEGGDLKYRWFFGDGETSTDPSPIHKYTNEGHYKVTLIVTDDVDQSQQQTEMVTVGTPPKVSILSPIEGQHFAVGEVLQLNGLAVGADGNLLEASQLRWSARKHHDTHYHPFLEEETGNSIGLYPAPPPENSRAATNSHLEILLTATDPRTGLSSTASALVMPQVVSLTFDSEPAGLELIIDGEVTQTPRTIVTWANHSVSVQVYDQGHFQFSNWENGQDAHHKIYVPFEDTVYTVVFDNVCLNEVSEQLLAVEIGAGQFYGSSKFYCLLDNIKFGIDGSGAFGLFKDYELIWTPLDSTENTEVRQWYFNSDDGTVTVISANNETIWSSSMDSSFQSIPGSKMVLDHDGVRVQSHIGISWQLDIVSFDTEASLSSLLTCSTPISVQWTIPVNTQYERGDLLCLRDRYKFGIDETGIFGFFRGSEVVWSPNHMTAGRWVFQDDGNLVVYAVTGNEVVWASMHEKNYQDAENSELSITKEGLVIQKEGSTLWKILIEDHCVAFADMDASLGVSTGEWYVPREFYCLEGDHTRHRVGINKSGAFGYFNGNDLVWEPWKEESERTVDSWRFQTDGNLVVRSGSEVVWTSRMDTKYNLTEHAFMSIKKGSLSIETRDGTLWNATASVQERSFGSCVNSAIAFDASVLLIATRSRLGRGNFYCLQGENYRFGIDEEGNFGYFVNSELVWQPSNAKNTNSDATMWSFQADGNLVVWSRDNVNWQSDWESVSSAVDAVGAALIVSTEGLSIEKGGTVIWKADVNAEELVRAEQPNHPSLRGLVQYDQVR